MKNFLKHLVIVFLLIAGMSAVTVYRIRDIQGDKTGNKTLWEELRDRYTKGEADTTFLKSSVAATTYVKVADGWQLRDSIYFEDEVDYMVGQTSLEKAVNAIAPYDYVFPIGATIYNVVNTLAYADGRDIYQLFYVEKTDTITAISWVQGTQGVYTADSYNGIALYSVNVASGLCTKIDSTANDGEIWKGAVNSLQTKALTKTNILTPGIYAVGFVYNSSAQTTAPTLANFAASTMDLTYINNMLPNAIKLCSRIGPTATNLKHTFNFSETSNYNAIPYVLLR